MVAAVGLASNFVSASAGTSHVISLPSSGGGVNRSGCRAFLFVTTGNTGNVVTATGWTLLSPSNSGRLVIYYKDLTSETSVTVGTSLSTKIRAIVDYVSGFDSSSAPACSASAVGTSVSPNSGAVSSGGGGHCIFFSGAGWTISPASSASGVPTGYVGNNTGASDNSTQPGIIVSYKVTTAAATNEDPSAFTISQATSVWEAFTVRQRGVPILQPDVLHQNTQIIPPTLNDTVPSLVTGFDASATTSRNVPLPASPAGKRVVIALSLVSATLATVPSGWTSLVNSNTTSSGLLLIYRDCDGTEGATVAIVTPSIRASWMVHTFNAGDFDPAAAPVVGGGTTTSSTNVPDPAAANGSWTSDPGTMMLTYIASTTSGNGLDPPDAPPSGYFGTTNAGLTSGVASLFVALRNVQGVGDDPGAWAWTGNAQRRPATLAIKAAPSGKFATASLTFTTPSIKWEPPLHQNTQEFYAPKLAFTYKPTLHQNTQQFFTVSLRRTLKIAAGPHQNTQVFYAPRLRMTYKVALHQNNQQFFGPTIVVAPLAITLQVPFHQNTQQFFAPRLRMTYRIAALHQNNQQFYGPVLSFPPVPGFVQPPRHQNLQQFFGPTLVFGGAPLTVIAPFHQNLQQFYGPTLVFGTTPPTPTPPDDASKRGSSGFDPHYFKKRNKRRTKTDEIVEFLRETENVTLPPDLQHQAHVARTEAENFLRGLANSNEIALREINYFFALLRAAIKLRRALEAEEDEDDLLLISS